MPPGASDSDTPWFNIDHVSNNSPFQQQVTFQPAIQCMYSRPTTDSTTTAPTAATRDGQRRRHPDFSFAMPQGSRCSPLRRPPRAGSVRGREGPERPRHAGNAGDRSGQLGQCCRAERGGFGVQRSTYTDGGMVGAIAAASVRFLVSFFDGLKVDTCNDTATVSPAVRGEHGRDRLRDQRGVRPDPGRMASHEHVGGQHLLAIRGRQPRGLHRHPDQRIHRRHRCSRP